MIKKILIGIGCIIVLYFFLSIIFPKYMGIPIAAYESKKAWIDYEQKQLTDSITKFPTSIGIINDYGQVFTESQRKELNNLLYDYNIETTRQIVVVTIDSIMPFQNIQKYAADLGNDWGVGTAEKNNGLTIVVCTPCQQIGIATGYGTELVLTDKICKGVMDSVMIPEFKNEKYYDGIKNGVMELIAKWE